MNNIFPRTVVEDISLPRMLIGSNWLLGFSHTTATMDEYIKQTHDKKSVAAILEAYLEYGIDAIMCCISDAAIIRDAIKLAEDKTGKGIMVIDTPIIDVSDTAEARREAERVIKQGAAYGAKLSMPHHASVEKLVCKGTESIDRLPDYLNMIRDNGMVPGVSAHMPELIIYSDLNEYDVQAYIQIFNCMGFLMQVEIEYIHKVIWEAKKPVMTIKSMAAGRCTPFVGLTFNYNTIRPCDMVTVGAFNANEVHEDVEIALAAIEHRRPILEGRRSVAASSIIK